MITEGAFSPFFLWQLLSNFNLFLFYALLVPLLHTQKHYGYEEVEDALP